ncbi:MAG: hypothetical protein R3E64_13010 [Halioglobus sp.]
MTFKPHINAIALSLGLCLLASQAHAIAVSAVTLQNSGGGYDNASASAQGLKKPKKSVINGLDGLFAGDQWTVLDKSNKPSKTFNGVDFVLTADSRQRSGDWGLTWNDSDLAQYMDFVVILKGGKQWAAYLFEAGSIGVDSLSANGIFDMPLVKKKNGKTAKLRRATIMGRLADLPIDIDVPPPGSGDGTQGSGDGTQGSGDGTQGSGDGTQGSGDGTQGSGDGTQGSGDGTQGSGDGTQGSGGGTQGSGGGTQGSGDGTQGSGDGTQGSGDGTQGSGAGTADQNPNSVPTPGSFALFTLGLALCRRQLRRRSVS